MTGIRTYVSSLKDALHENVKDCKAHSWKVVGQEQDGTLLVTWISGSHNTTLRTNIGCINQFDNTFQVLLHLSSVKNVIQATVNCRKTILVYVTKDKSSIVSDTDVTNKADEHKWVYETFITVTIDGSSGGGDSEDRRGETHHTQVLPKKCQQVMAQFLYKKKQTGCDKFLLFVHQEFVNLNHVDVKVNDNAKQTVEISLTESVLKAFTWAQWDAGPQCLYYIHYRKPPQCVEGETREEDDQVMPILSTLQFHDDMPHETVLNIPLNLPQLPRNTSSPCGVYEDDPVPLRVHDCSLDLTVIADHRGIVCICHHYLYQPVKPPLCEKVLETSNTIHFAYSVTMLHHGRVVHCVVPGVPWGHASDFRPTFTMQGDQHLVVYSPGLFVHLLDIGPSHEPCCHIILGDDSVDKSNITHLATLWQPSQPTPDKNAAGNSSGTRTISNKSPEGSIAIDFVTLNVYKIEVSTQFLIDSYKHEDIVLSNRLAILHYFMIHLSDMDTVAELLMPLGNKMLDLDVPKVLQEVLIGGAFASMLRNLPSDALPLVSLLPMTTWNINQPVEVKLHSHLSMSLSQESLWNPAVMLLSPQQRLVPFRTDMWTRLWDLLSTNANLVRFKPTTVADKLMVSLVCYQPEALSRCSTPLSPGGALVGSSGTLSDLASISGGRTNKTIQEPLPFYEVESCAASKQEHVISVNLREVSMHLLKRGQGRETPMQVHAVATRYAAAQLELSRVLCQLMTRAAGVNTNNHERGFSLIEELSQLRRKALFTILERYCLAVEALAFPLPQGFPSFFAYLAYRTIPFFMFLQYVQANVLQLQIDVMKAIMADLPDNGEGLKRKLQLLQMLPRSRAKRLLNQWQHPVSLMVRAREHALNILSGVEGTHARGHPQRAKNQVTTRGLAAFPSADRLSPLDTFLDLLTAKASLAELDFNLLIEATMTSTEEFLD